LIFMIEIIALVAVVTDSVPNVRKSGNKKAIDRGVDTASVLEYEVRFVV
jgi:hypothetical protein